MRGLRLIEVQKLAALDMAWLGTRLGRDAQKSLGREPGSSFGPRPVPAPEVEHPRSRLAWRAE